MTFEADIQSVLKELSSKDWNVRFRSLEKLQVLVQDSADNTGVWTKEVLISLHKPLINQLKDLRSSIVREVRSFIIFHLLFLLRFERLSTCMHLLKKICSCAPPTEQLIKVPRPHLGVTLSSYQLAHLSSHGPERWVNFSWHSHNCSATRTASWAVTWWKHNST